MNGVALKPMRLALFCLMSLFLVLTAPAFATELRIGIDNPDLGKLDPHATTVSGDRYIIQDVFSGLVRYKPGSGDVRQIEPDLAEKWTSSSDGKVWTFHLRHGVKWHHGYGEVTAEDVVFSLNRAANKETSRFASDYTAFDKVEALDRYTVRITLKQVVPSLLGLVVNSLGGNIVCKKAVEKLGAGYAQNPIGTGPFMFEAYKPQNSVTLVANPDYFRGKPKIDRVIFRYIKSQGSRDLALRSGELDISGGAQGQDWVERTMKLPGIKVDTAGLPEIWSLFIDEDFEAARRYPGASGDRVCGQPARPDQLPGRGRVPRGEVRRSRSLCGLHG